MTFKANDSAWTTKGATLSDKSAEKVRSILRAQKIPGYFFKE